MPDLAHVHPTFDELGRRGFDVGNDKMRLSVGAWRRVRIPVPMVIEQAEPGGVICTTRNPSPGLTSTSRVKPTVSV
jgi:hypothetical protein